jgi:hypothetical protein
MLNLWLMFHCCIVPARERELMVYLISYYRLWHSVCVFIYLKVPCHLYLLCDKSDMIVSSGFGKAWHEAAVTSSSCCVSISFSTYDNYLNHISFIQGCTIWRHMAWRSFTFWDVWLGSVVKCKWRWYSTKHFNVQLLHWTLKMYGY